MDAAEVYTFQSDTAYNGTEIMLAARSEGRNSPFTLHELSYFLPLPLRFSRILFRIWRYKTRADELDSATLYSKIKKTTLYKKKHTSS